MLPRFPTFYIIILFIYMAGQGCTSDPQVEKIHTSEKVDSIFKSDPFQDESTSILLSSAESCAISPADFFRLSDRNLQREFFQKADSIKKERYPDTEPDSIFIELTPGRLSQFLKDLDRKKFLETGVYEREYHFDLAPYPFKDSEECKDKISVIFNKEECTFRIIVYNEFFEEWCQESNVIYIFRIEGNSISTLQIHEAG